MRSMKFNHFVFHIMVALATISLASAILFRTDFSDENLYRLYEVASGVTHLIAATLIAGSVMFFTAEHDWEACTEFDKTMLIPLVPAVLLAFQSSELFASAVYVDAITISYWAAGIGILNCLFIPRHKKLSLHSILKILSILIYLATLMLIWFDGPWFTLAIAFAGIFSLFSLIYSYAVSYKY